MITNLITEKLKIQEKKPVLNAIKNNKHQNMLSFISKHEGKKLLE